METAARIRREFFVKGRSIKEIVRIVGVSRNPVRKVLRSGETAFAYERPPQPPQPKPKGPGVSGSAPGYVLRQSRQPHSHPD